MKSFWIFVLLPVLVSSALAIDREAFTITKYDLQVRLEPAQSRLGARGKLTLRNDSAEPQKIAVLQLSSSLDWRSIKVDGKAVQFVAQPFASDIDHTGALSEAIVTLPAALKPKGTVEIEIAYEGTIVRDATRLTQIGVPENIARHTSWDQISPSFTAVRGVGYVAWYPIATESADFSEGNSMFQVVERWKKREQDASVSITFASDAASGSDNLKLLCNGIAVLKNSHGDSLAQSKWGCEYQPLRFTAPGFANAVFDSKDAGSLTVSYLRGHEDGASAYVSQAESASAFAREWFAETKARENITDLVDPNAAPFESGSILFASLAAVDSKLAAINSVHMLVHSAFQSPRPWIDEGLAHFAEAVYREKQDGRHAALLLLGLHRAAFLDAEKETATSPQKEPADPLATTFDEAYYRSKAAYVWWMLRDMIGEDALKQAIHSYRPAEDKDPQYMERLVTAAAKRDLHWFFDDWVYHDRGLPDFHVQAVHPWKNEKGIQLVTITIENLGNAGAEVPFTVQFSGGDITRRLEVRAKSAATTRLEVPSAPTEVMVNDGSVPESDLANNAFRVSEP